MPKCQATTKAGERCNRWAIAGDRVCVSHVDKEWIVGRVLNKAEPAAPPSTNGIQATLVQMIRCPHCGQLSEPPALVRPLEG